MMRLRRTEPSERVRFQTSPKGGRLLTMLHDGFGTTIRRDGQGHVYIEGTCQVVPRLALGHPLHESRRSGKIDRGFLHYSGS